MSLKLNEVLSITPEEYGDWTICLNNANADNEVYSFEEDRESLMSHISWHKTNGRKRPFRSINTKYCLQFIRLDRDKKYSQWLFLGAYEKKGIIERPDHHQIYDLRQLDRFDSFIERLIVEYKKIQGPKQAKIGISNIENIDVVKILEKPYIKTDMAFKGYDNISLSFKELKKLINSNVDNWRELLSNINCIYVITDKTNGQLYIGSTYGYEGVWQRWSSYVFSDGTGGNKKLKELMAENNDYANKNFQFSILETFLNTNHEDKNILQREKYWKQVFDSINHGYNEN